jgi:Peptidase A4 family
MNLLATPLTLTSKRQALRLAVLMGFAAVAMLVSTAGQAPLRISHAPHVEAANSQDNAASYSTNWSGYATYQTATTFTDVKGTWVQPSVSCPSKGAQYASFWVGLDGYNSNSVEQIGTDSDCGGRNRPVYYAWYEMYPAYPVNLSMAVHPGDTMSAEVVTSGSAFTLTITNVTTGATFSTQQTAAAALTSAEWVAEAPSSCSRFRCSVLPLANFGTVNFSGSYTTGNGHTGTISDGTWSNDQITMVTSTGTTIKAQPSALSPDGTAFSVKWNHQ